MHDAPAEVLQLGHRATGQQHLPRQPTVTPCALPLRGMDGMMTLQKREGVTLAKQRYGGATDLATSEVGGLADGTLLGRQHGLQLPPRRRGCRQEHLHAQAPFRCDLRRYRA